MSASHVTPKRVRPACGVPGLSNIGLTVKKLVTHTSKREQHPGCRLPGCRLAAACFDSLKFLGSWVNGHGEYIYI